MWLQANKTTKTKSEPKEFCKARQAAQCKKHPVNVPSFLDGAQDWEIAVDLMGQGGFQR